MAQRITDAAEIEQRLLDLAYTTDIKLTAPALAYFAPCSIEDATKVLDALATRDLVQMDVEDSGTIVYHVPAREQVPRPIAAPTPTPAPAPAPLMPIARALPFHRVARVSPLLAMILAFMIPGAGHLYAGRFLAAVGWFFAVSLGYALIIPGLVFHAISIVSAAATASRANAVLALPHYQVARLAA